MAGKPISRLYAARICDYGVAKIFDRVENGETIKSIASSLGMSRGWLSTYLNQDPCTAQALALSRAIAAHKLLAVRLGMDRQPEVRQRVVDGSTLHLEAVRRLATRLEMDSRPEVRKYAADAPAMHLEAMKQIERGRTTSGPIGPSAARARAFLAPIPVPSGAETESSRLEGTGKPVDAAVQRSAYPNHE